MRGIGVGEVIIGSLPRLNTGSNGIEVHGPMGLATGSGPVPVHACARIDLDRLPRLLDQVAAEVHAADSGSLRVCFATGRRRDVPVSPDSLGWVVGLQGGRFITPMLGGVKMADRRSA